MFSRTGTLWSGFLVGWLAMVGLACSSGSSAEERDPSSATPSGAAIRAEKVVFREFNRKLRVQANLIPNRKAAVAPKVQGILLRVEKKVGDKVQAGDLLFQVDPSDYLQHQEQAQAQLAQAKAALLQAQTASQNLKVQHQRVSHLLKKGAISDAEFEKMDAALSSSLASVEMAKAQVTMAEVGLRTARTAVADCSVRAPFGGYVVSRLMDEGELVRAMPPSVVVVLMEIDPVVVEASVSELDVQQVHEGLSVEVRVEAFSGESIRTRIDRVNRLVDPASRTVVVRASLENPEGRFHPGMAASMELVLAEENALSLPREAVFNQSGRTGQVYVVSDGVARLQEVQLGEKVDGVVAVLAGLDAGDEVIVAGLSRVRDGRAVSVIVDGQSHHQNAVDLPVDAHLHPKPHSAHPATSKKVHMAVQKPPLDGRAYD